MMMHMLRAGGIEPCEGSNGHSCELPDLSADRLSRVNLVGRSVKLLDFAQRETLPDADWRFVWVDRDPVQQALSTSKFLHGTTGFRLNGCDVERLADSFARDRPGNLSVLRAYGPVLVFQFERVLARPFRAARSLDRFVSDAEFGSFDREAAGSVVHDRGPGCLPDLAFELGS